MTSNTDKPRILVVDDEKDLADNISEAIKNTAKYEVLTAYQAKEAMRLLMENGTIMGLLPNRIGLVILDIKMPEVDGLQFLEMLREQRATRRIGVFFLTAFDDEVMLEKARLGEAAGYILKPFKKEDLLKQIELFFDGREKWLIEETKWETRIWASSPGKDK